MISYTTISQNLKAIRIFTLFILFFAFMPVLLLAQEVPNSVNYVGSQINTYRTDGKPELNPVSEYQKPEEVTKLEKIIYDIKKSGNPDQSGVIELQKQIDAITKQSITLPGGYYPGRIIQAGPKEQLDAIGNTAILYKNNIKSIATVTEYVGTTAGKIWAIVGYEGTGSSSTPDSLMILSSTDNGFSWIPYANIALGGTDKINPGEIDVELIEGGTNKYLYILFGLRATGGTGKWFSAGASVRITETYAGNLWTLNWPGYNATKRYYCPRLVSDNTTWPTAPWIYIAVSFDSAGATGRVNTQKYAQINTPNTISPTILYKANKIYWVSNTATMQNLYTDIAYFQNGFTDSTIISYCGVPDSTKVFFSKMSGSGFISPSSPGQYIGFIGGSEPNFEKFGGRLSSNGNNNGSVFFIFNQKSATIDGVKYFRTTNFGNFNSMYQSVIWTASAGVSLPDILGFRNSNTHRIAFFFKGATDSLKYISVSTGGTFISNSGKMNHINNTTTSFPPAAGYRSVSGESCFALYSGAGLSDVWSAQGCSGLITNITHSETPVSFSLKQNYPNPFNPSTKISFSLPKSGFVSLKVYDVLGTELLTLVGEIKSAGNYLIDFNAAELPSGVYFYKLETDSFSKTMKMLLIK